jgi:hypothetical protein
MDEILSINSTRLGRFIHRYQITSNSRVFFILNDLSKKKFFLKLFFKLNFQKTQENETIESTFGNFFLETIHTSNISQIERNAQKKTIKESRQKFKRKSG